MALNQLIPSATPPPSSGDISSWSSYLSGVNSPISPGAARINGLIFDYVGEVRSELEADITEHYMEDNSFVQDHVALKPKRVVMKGLIGELVAGPQQSGIPGVLQNLQNGLTTVPAYLGGYSPQVTQKLSRAVSQAQKVASQLTAVYSTGKNILSLFKGASPSPTKQAQIYAALESFFQQRIPFQVVTPFRIYDSMVIESVIAVQPEDTKYLSEFTVTLKEIRRASLTLLDPTAPQKPGGVLKNTQQWDPGHNQGRNYAEAVVYDPTTVAAKFTMAGVKLQ